MQKLHQLITLHFVFQLQKSQMKAFMFEIRQQQQQKTNKQHGTKLKP